MSLVSINYNFWSMNHTFWCKNHVQKYSVNFLRKRKNWWPKQLKSLSNRNIARVFNNYITKGQNDCKKPRTCQKPKMRDRRLLIKYYSNKMISLSRIMSDLHISATKSTISRVIKADPNIINKKKKT